MEGESIDNTGFNPGICGKIISPRPVRFRSNENYYTAQLWPDK